jgi:hypothetical protein
MSTQTRPRNRSTASSRRFAKSGASSQGRRSTGSGARRTTSTAGRPRTINVMRRKPPKSNTDKALGALMGLVGGKKPARSGSKGAKAGAGVAMLTAAAGLAFKNRDKLTSMLKRDGGAPETDASRPPAGTTGAQVHPVTRANATHSVTEPTGTGPTGDGTSASSSPGDMGMSSSLGATDTTSSLGATETTSSPGAADMTSGSGAAGMSSSLGAADTTSSLHGADTPTSVDPADASSPLGAADAPSSLDAPDMELGGGAGSGTAETRQTDVPFVSPREPGTDEPPARS